MMRKLFAFALLSTVALAVPAKPSSSRATLRALAEASEQYANSNAYNEFPRFHAWVNVLNKKDGSGGKIVLARHSGVSDVKGVFHTAGIVPGPIFGGQVFQPAYFETRAAVRRANGFSEPFNLCTDTSKYCETPDITTTSDGEIHVVWEQNKSTLDGVTDVFYRRKNATGTWDTGSLNLTNNPSNPDPGVGFLNKFSLPRIAVDANNKLHAVFYRVFFDAATSTDLREIYYASKPSGGSWSSWTLVRGGSTSGSHPVGSVRVDALADGTPKLMWLQSNGVVFTTTFNTGSGQWNNPDVTIATSASEPDFTIDSADVSHYVYVTGGTVKYEKTDAGTEETIATGTGPQILVDSRSRPNVVWLSSSGVGYARKVPAEVWSLQNPIAEIGRSSLNDVDWPMDVGPLRLALDQSDRLYVMEGGRSGLVSWTYEPNLGGQDSFVTFPWGPNASANAGTGNVNFDLGLFSSRGVGFSSSFGLTYNSLDPEPGDLARGWTHSHQMRIIDSAVGSAEGHDTLSLVFGDGRAAIFRYSGSYTYSVADPEYGYFSKIVRAAGGGADWVSSTYTLTTKSNLEYAFNSSGRLITIKDKNTVQNTLTLAYGDNPASTAADTVLLTITDSAGRITTLNYDSQDRLLQVVDPGGKTYDLTYGATSKNVETVKFTSGPSTPTWKLEYYAAADTDPEKRLNLLKKIFTPKGQAGAGTAPGVFYSWLLGYWADGRARSSTEPSVSSITDEAMIDAAPGDTQAKRELAYIDPPSPGIPHTASVPKAEFTNRRGYKTTVEYQYRRCLADKITDAQTPTAGVIQRFFDGYNFTTPPSSVPQFRSLIRFTDKRSAITIYKYVAGTPAHVQDNLEKIWRPKTVPTPDPLDTLPLDAGDANFTPAIVYTYTTDNFNRVATAKDSRGFTTTYTYLNGNLTNIVYPQTTDPDSQTQNATESFEYDSNGRMFTSTDAEGNVTTRSVVDTPTGLFKNVQRPGGGSPEQFTFDPMGNVATHTLPQGELTTFNRDGLYRVDTEVGPKITSDFDYDVDSNVTQVTVSQPGQGTMPAQISKSIYDDIGRLTESTVAFGSPEAATSKAIFDREGNTRKTQDQRAISGGYFNSKALFDELSRLKEDRRDGTGEGAAITHTSTAKYDLNGNVTERIEQPGGSERKTTYTYTARNQIEETTYPITSIKDHSCYDDNDNVTLSQRRDGATFMYGTFNVFDQRNRLRTMTQLGVDPGAGCQENPTISGPLWRYFYNKNSSTRKVRDPLAKQTEWTYDERERQKQTRKTINGGTRDLSNSIYDGNDRRTEEHRLTTTGAQPEKVQEFVYLDGELRTEKDVFGFTTDYEYILGNLTKRTDPKPCVVEWVYDSQNRVTLEKQDPTGLDIRTSYGYDPVGNKTSITVFNPATSANNAQYIFTYDRANRLVRLQYPLFATCPDETWEYNDFGQLKKHTDRNNKVVDYFYDLMGRLTAEIHRTPYSKYMGRTYDGAGNLLTIYQNNGESDTSSQEFKSTRTYDKLNRQLSDSWTVAGAAFKNVTYHYNDASYRDEMHVLETATVTHLYGYDSANNPTTISRAGVTHATSTYYNGGQKKEVLLGNGAKYSYTLDKKDRLTSLKTLSSGGSIIAGFDYLYDSRDNRTSVALPHAGVTITYSYDCVSRLTGEAWTSSDCLPTVVNLFTSQSQGNESGFSNEACAAPKAPLVVPAYFAFFDYDKAGNRKTITALDRKSTYTYDAENRLTTETPLISQKVSLLNVSASDTETGFSAGTASDGVTLDSTSSSFAWKSTASAGQHWLELAFVDGGGNPLNQSVAQVRCYFPTTVGGVSKFKVQYWTGSAWADAPALAVSGAAIESIGSSWYKTNCHEVVFGFAAVSTQKIRFLQESAGGGTANPNVAYLNELEAYAYVSQPSISYTFDCNGNTKTRTVTGSTKESYSYDFANRMTAYTKEQLPSFTLLTSYTYSIAPTGYRYQKQNVLANTKELYMNDGADVVTDYTQSGSDPIQFATSYVGSLAIDSKIGRVSGAGTHYYAPDALGSAHMLLDSGQSATNTNFTTAWGEGLPGFSGGGSVSDRYGITQREKDNESDLMHYRARSFNPSIGRFQQKDPLTPIMTHYVYVGNRPTLASDPTGMVMQVPTTEEKNLDAELEKRGISGYSKRVDGKDTLFFGTDHSKVKHADGRVTETFWRMIVNTSPKQTPRTFKFPTAVEAEANAFARISIAESAIEVSTYNQGEGALPKGWKDTEAFTYKNPSAALDEWFTPSGQTYKVGCLQGAHIAQLRGIAAYMNGVERGRIAPGGNFDKRAGGAQTISQLAEIYLNTSKTNSWYDWLPGDRGWIENVNHANDKEGFMQGQNLIYLGGTFEIGPGSKFLDVRRFWGLTGSGGSVQSLKEWRKFVSEFDSTKSDTIISTLREGPSGSGKIGK